MEDVWQLTALIGCGVVLSAMLLFFNLKTQSNRVARVLTYYSLCGVSATSVVGFIKLTATVF